MIKKIIFDDDIGTFCFWNFFVLGAKSELSQTQYNQIIWEVQYFYTPLEMLFIDNQGYHSQR